MVKLLFQKILVISMVMTPFLTVFAQNDFSKDLNDYVFDLSSLFKNNAEFYKTEAYIKNELLKVEKFNENLNKKEGLLNALSYMYGTRSKATNMAQYGFLNLRTNDSKENNNLLETGDAMLTQVNTKFSAIEENIRHLDKKKVENWLKKDERFKKYKKRIYKIFFKAEHLLQSEEQKIVESFKKSAKVPYQIFKEYRKTNRGSTIDLNGEKVQLNFDSFNKFRRHDDKLKREKVISEYFKFLGTQKDVYAKLLLERIKADVHLGKLQKFDNGMDALWYMLDGMPNGSYTKMINTVEKNSEVLQRYLKLKSKLLRVEKFTYYDFFAPNSKIDKDISIDKAMEIAIKASKPLGKEYQINLKKRLHSNLFHIAPTEGKDMYYYGIFPATGDGHSYTIMSYNNSIDDSSALMGATALMMAWENIPEGMTSDTGDDPGIFANGLIYLGNLLHDDYLLQTSKSKQERIAILSSTLERIWVRFFRYVLVTEWENEIQNSILENKTLTGEDLSKMYYDLLKKYYKETTIPKEAAHEWMTYRVPFYSFEHQFWPAAMAGASAIFNKLKEGDSSGLDIMNVLGTSDLDMTYTLFKDAGIDMTTEKPYQAVIQLMSYLMDLLEKEI